MTVFKRLLLLHCCMTLGVLCYRFQCGLPRCQCTFVTAHGFLELEADCTANKEIRHVPRFTRTERRRLTRIDMSGTLFCALPSRKDVKVLCSGVSTTTFTIPDVLRIQSVRPPVKSQTLSPPHDSSANVIVQHSDGKSVESVISTTVQTAQSYNEKIVKTDITQTGTGQTVTVEPPTIQTSTDETSVETTEVKTTMVETTTVETTTVQSTAVQTTAVQTTTVQTTTVQTTALQTSGVQTTAVQTSGVQSQAVQTFETFTLGEETFNLTSAVELSAEKHSDITQTSVDSQAFLTPQIAPHGVQHDEGNFETNDPVLSTLVSGSIVDVTHAEQFEPTTWTAELPEQGDLTTEGDLTWPSTGIDVFFYDSRQNETTDVMHENSTGEITIYGDGDVFMDSPTVGLNTSQEIKTVVHVLNSEELEGLIGAMLTLCLLVLCGSGTVVIYKKRKRAIKDGSVKTFMDTVLRWRPFRRIADLEEGIEETALDRLGQQLPPTLPEEVKTTTAECATTPLEEVSDIYEWDSDFDDTGLYENVENPTMAELLSAALQARDTLQSAIVDHVIASRRGSRESTPRRGSRESTPRRVVRESTPRRVVRKSRESTPARESRESTPARVSGQSTLKRVPDPRRESTPKRECRNEIAARGKRDERQNEKCGESDVMRDAGATDRRDARDADRRDARDANRRDVADTGRILDNTMDKENTEHVYARAHSNVTRVHFIDETDISVHAPHSMAQQTVDSREESEESDKTVSMTSSDRLYVDQFFDASEIDIQGAHSAAQQTVDSQVESEESDKTFSMTSSDRIYVDQFFDASETF